MRRTRTEGMTLIEVLMAMAILAIISTLMYEGFVQTSHNKKRIESEIDRYHEIRMGLERMARELSMAYVSAQLNPNIALRTVQTAFIGIERGSGSRIDFASFSHRRLYRDAHESDQNELAYFVTQHPEHPGMDVLARREQRRVDDDPESGGQSQILIEDVISLELSYLDPLSGEWLSSWDTREERGLQPNRLPSQVKILLTVPNVRGRGPEQTFGTRASIRIEWALNHAIYKAL